MTVLESLLRSLPHRFLISCLPTCPLGVAEVSIRPSRGREQNKGGRKLARPGELASLFPENECNFYAFPREAGPSELQRPRCCRGE